MGFLKFHNTPTGARWSNAKLRRCQTCSYYIQRERVKGFGGAKTPGGNGDCYVDRPKKREVHERMICPRFIFEPGLSADYEWDKTT
jgi:hypothetical protein